MVRELVVFPDERINIASADIRVFDESLFELLEDLKDTIEANDAEGLAAIQIGTPSPVVVIKTDDGYLELINPRVLRKSGSVSSAEKTLYLPGIERTIERYETISIIYQDRYGEQRAMKAAGSLSLLIQRKFDYVFGGSFAGKMDHKGRVKIEKEMHKAGVSGSFDSYAPVSKREYFKSMMSKLLFLEFLTLFSGLFGFAKETMLSLYHFDQFVTIAVLILIAGYFIYARYEAERVVSCTGCQMVNFISVSLKYFAATAALFTASCFLVNPY
jgi:peptide deformylase